MVAATALALAVVGIRGGTTPAGATPPGTVSNSAYAPGATTIAGTGAPGYGGDGGVAVAARLDAPAGVAVDSSGDLFVADAGNCRVREVPAASGGSFGHQVRAGHIVTVAGGACGAGGNQPPTAVAVDTAGDLFIAFGTGDRVDELPARSGRSLGRGVTAGKLAVVAAGPLDDPSGLAIDPTGDLFIADTGNCRLRMVASSTGTRFGMAVAEGGVYTVAGTGICGSDGDGGPATQAQLWDPGALATDAAGDVFVADQGNRTIRVLTSHAGTFYGVALGADHLGAVAGEGSYGPYLVDGISAIGETGELNFPTGIAVAADGDLYIADGAMHAIRLVPSAPTTLLGKPARADDMYIAAGALSVGILHNRTEWIQTHMLDPTGLALSPGGQLVYSDAQADVVRRLPAGS